MTKPTNHLAAKTVGGIAALAAAAATAYYFAMDDKAASHRQKAKVWMSKAKKEVVKEIKSLKTLSRPAYEAAVAGVLNKYRQNKDVSLEEVTGLAKELKGHWNNIAAKISPKAKAAPKRKTAAKRKAGKK